MIKLWKIAIEFSKEHFTSTRSKTENRVLYLTLVRSQLEHCSVVWRPTSAASIKPFEVIQRRAVKWIHNEPYASYNDNDYLCKLNKIDILPIGYKFLVTDLLLFHKIVYNNICIKLPEYIRLVAPCSMPNPLKRLRPRKIIDIQNDHPIFQCSLKHISQCQEDPLLLHVVLNHARS